MAHDEDPGMHAMPATDRDAMANPRRAEPQLDEVVERDDAVLCQRPLGDPPAPAVRMVHLTIVVSHVLP